MGKNISVKKSAIITNNDSIIKYFNEIKKYKTLDLSEEIELFKNKSEKSKELIINSNLRFVSQVAAKYVGMGIDLEDLIAFGRVGLIEAYDRYDYKKGVKFITFSIWYIRAEIQKSLNELSRTVRIPNHHKEKSQKIDDISDYKEMINCDNSPNLDCEDLSFELNFILDKLKPREREALTRYYGIGWEDEQDMEFIAKEMGIGQERVRQMIRRSEEAIRGMKNYEILKKWNK